MWPSGLLFELRKHNGECFGVTCLPRPPPHSKAVTLQRSILEKTIDSTMHQEMQHKPEVGIMHILDSLYRTGLQVLGLGIMVGSSTESH